MSEEMKIDGKSHISSKRASESTGYSQDYIGQLARKSLIEARRIGGLWYVSMESLESYKQKAAEFKPEPPGRVDATDLGTLISFDGKEYLSAARAAEQTGYTQDYVGQLARAGTILSRQIGNRWYVDREAIFSHKKDKDSLLAAVQAESVGLARPIAGSDIRSGKVSKAGIAVSEPLLTYITENADLMPSMSKELGGFREENDALHGLSDQTAIPIKRIHDVTSSVGKVRIGSRGAAPLMISEAKRSVMPLLLASAATIVIVLSVGYASILKQNSVYAVVTVTGSGTMAALALSVEGDFSWIGNILEPLLTRELVYVRSATN